MAQAEERGGVLLLRRSPVLGKFSKRFLDCVNNQSMLKQKSKDYYANGWRLLADTGDYFRIAKDVALKASEEDLKNNVKVHAPGTAFSTLLEELARLSADAKCNNLEVTFLSNKVGEDGQKIVQDGKYVAEIRSFGIHVFGDETRGFLKEEFERFPVLSLLFLWTRYGAGKIGILRLQPVRGDNESLVSEYQEWEGKAIAAYHYDRLSSKLDATVLGSLVETPEESSHPQP